MKVILHIVFILGIAVPLALCQSEVCSYIASGTQTSYRVTQESFSVSYSCGFWGGSRCSRTAYRYIVYMYSSHVVYHTETRCCSGYTGDGTQCSPICSNCTDREVCVAPEECVCSAGWTGENCTEDVDECLSTDVCHHFCTNTPGSYYCTCEDDSVLANDQSSCLDSPQNTRLLAIRSTSLNLTWERPDWNGTIIEYLSTCSPDGGTFHNANVPSQTSHDIYSIHLNALSPHTTYTCCVTASTTHGVSHSSCDTQTTLEDVPSDSPVNVTVTAVSPFAVEIEWRPPTTPNGIINYTVYTNNIAITEWSLTRYLYEGLSPYEQVSISVSASTKIGEGPRSIEVSIRTPESVPGVVDIFEVVALSPNLLRVSWDPPLSPNGVLTGYQVEVVNLIDASDLLYLMAEDMQQRNISDTIEPYVPYRVSVRAATSVGGGEPVEVIIFTLEGVPQKAPIIVSVLRENATTAVIEWEELSWEDRRGVLTSYEIVYDDMTSDQCPATNSFDNTLSVNEGSLDFVITDLDPGLQYCVGVAAKTSAGIGEFMFTVVPWYTNNVFSVALDKVNCTYWTLNMASEKMDDLVHEIAKGIEQFCRCGFSSEYIAEERLTCNKTDLHQVLLQGRIISTNDRDSSDLVGDLEEWVSSGPTVVVQGKKLQVVSSETSPDASSDGEQEGSSPPWAVVGTFAAAGFCLLIIIPLIVCVVYFKCKRQRSTKMTVTNLADSKVRDNADRYSQRLPSMKAAAYEEPQKSVDLQPDIEIPSAEDENIYENPDMIMEKVDSTVSNDNAVCNPTYDDGCVAKPSPTAMADEGYMYVEMSGQDEDEAYKENIYEET